MVGAYNVRFHHEQAGQTADRMNAPVPRKKEHVKLMLKHDPHGGKEIMHGFVHEVKWEYPRTVMPIAHVYLRY